MPFRDHRTCTRQGFSRNGFLASMAESREFSGTVYKDIKAEAVPQSGER